MNENAKKWVAALESGEYKQARGVLRKKRGGKFSYCCLGVACDLYQKEHPDVLLDSREVDNVTYFFGYYNGSHEFNGTLPDVVRDWLGLESRSGTYRTLERTSLTSLNDEERRTFKTIAKVIRSEPEGLFIKES